MKKRRKFAERIIACVLAALMVVGVVPLDFADFGAKEVKAADRTIASYTSDFDESGTVTASWSYDNNLTDESGNGIDTIQKGAKGTYSSDTGKLYVDTVTVGKFSLRIRSNKGNDIQVNAGTDIYVPVKGYKTVTKLTFKSGVVEDTISVEGVDGNLLGSKIEWSDNKNVTITSYTNGTVSDVKIKADKNCYVTSITNTSYNLSTVTMSGNVRGSNVPENLTVDVSFKDGDSKITYSGKVGSVYGDYSVTVPVEDKAKDYTVELSDPSCQISSGTTSYSWKKGDIDVHNDINISSISTVDLTVNITGFDAGYSASDLNVSVTNADDKFVGLKSSETNSYVYSVEQGAEYKIEVTGANDYSSSAQTVTCDATKSVEVTMTKKPTYNVNVKLGSGPSSEGIKYVFTHADGYKYEFTDKSSIALRDGRYSVSLEGSFDDEPYDVSTGDSVNIAGGDGTLSITFAKKTSWTFDKVYKKYEGNKGKYKGLEIDASSGKFDIQLEKAHAVLYTNTIVKVPVDGQCTMTVKASAGAQYALYSIGGENASDRTAASLTEYDSVYEYAGSAGYVYIVADQDNTGYIKSISLVYPEKNVDVVTQELMPAAAGKDVDAATGTTASVPVDTDGNPLGSNPEALVVTPEGQKLKFSNTSGNLDKSKFNNTYNVGYYLFPALSQPEEYILEFDAVVTSSALTDNGNGFFPGIYTDNFMSTLGLFKGGKSLRGIYSKNITASTSGITAGTYAGAGSPAEEVVGLNNKVHYVVTSIISESGGNKTMKSNITLSFTNSEGEYIKRSFSQGIPEITGVNRKYYYGFAVAGCDVTVMNMTYSLVNRSTDESGQTIVNTVTKYDQNAAYHPEGIAPTPTSVNAEASADRDYIDVTWDGSVSEGDGVYVVEVKNDDGDWQILSDCETGFAYRYILPEGAGGNFLFRVSGRLGQGKLSEAINPSNVITMQEPIYVLGALRKPVVKATGTDSSIKLEWEACPGATDYEVYRSESEDTSAATKIATVKTTNYSDIVGRGITNDNPYYYYVVATCSGNKSPGSDVVWTVAASVAAHTGDYVYENEATTINITKKSYDTLYTDNVVLEGYAMNDGTITAYIGGTQKDSKAVKAKETFAFSLTGLSQGRNTVELKFTDKNNKVTRLVYNYVYLTNYNYVVDASYSGTDGEAVNGIPTYKTVAAALAAVPADNSSNKVILVKEGNYEEYLTINKPNITLIGEDREMTSIHCYPGNYDSGAVCGGDMNTRCAVKVSPSASNFVAENITFANDYVYGSTNASNQSADALRVEAAGASFVNCKMQGVQDTLLVVGSGVNFEKCRIEGLVDFIYAENSGSAIFNDCEVVFRYIASKTSGYVCAPKTASSSDYGFVFKNCVVTSEPGCGGTGYLLCRPWGPDASVTWINCYMGKAINANTPYADMSGNSYMNARFYEYGTYGPAYLINSDRRQIRTDRANTLLALGSVPSDSSYKGTIVTSGSPKYIIKEYTDNVYSQSEGNDSGLAKFSQEGYASVYSVTGGGLLKENNENFYEVNSATEFLEALTKIKSSGKPSVINLKADVNLGSNEVDTDKYSSIIKPYSAQPLTHPTLIKSGASVLNLQGFNNLTIYSSNASSIKHASITMKKSTNIIIRNIKFDELWEWDEYTNGDYDRNDWDFMTIDDSTNGVWIDHCTFYKAYDGIVDIKNPNPVNNVTISWCEFLPGSEGNTFFNEMMNTMKANPSAYPYYKSLLDSGMSEEQIWWYAYGQKKTHLLGQSADATNAAGIRLTLANNYYKNSMDRMPRLRYGVAHVYNCIMDAQDLFTARASITNAAAAKHIVSNGASSTCDGQLLVENSYINGIINALNSGNGSDPSGYIDAINSLYYINGVRYKLEPKVNTDKAGEVVKKTDVSSFKSALGYSYNLRDAAKLSSSVVPYSGAGKVSFTTLQWEKSTYNDTYVSEGSTGSYNNNGLPDSPYTGDNMGGNNGNNGNGGNSGSGSDDTDSDSSDDDYDSSDDSSDTDSSNTSLTEEYDVLKPEEIPGATVTQIDGTNFAEIGEISAGAEKVIAAINAEGKITTDAPVMESTADVTSTVVNKLYNDASNIVTTFAKENTSITKEVFDKLKETGKTLSIGVVDKDGKVNSIVTIDGSQLTGKSVNFNLKITVDAKDNKVERVADRAGIKDSSYTIVDFEYSGNLPGTLKAAVNVSKKFADGTRVALYYYNSKKGVLENQYQVTTVSNGFAEFAIDHCSEYVLVDVSAAEGTITTSTLGSPKTADSNAIIFWLMLMCVAVLAFFGIQASKTNDKKKA